MSNRTPRQSNSQDLSSLVVRQPVTLDEVNALAARRRRAVASAICMANTWDEMEMFLSMFNLGEQISELTSAQRGTVAEWINRKRGRPE